MLKKIILVFKTHFDYGFTNLSEKVLEQYTTNMLNDVVNACVSTADLDKLKFVFTLPAWPLQAMLNSGQQHQTLVQLIQNNQVVWHALPFTLHTDFASTEDMVASLKYARELSAQFNKPLVKSVKMTDVPGHGWYIPSLLHQAGIEFLHIGCNEFPKYPAVPRLFFWQAPSGEHLLTMYYPDGYGDSRLIPEDWPFPVWMAMMHTHDNDGPQSPEAIRALVEKAQQQYPDVEIVSGSLDDFYNELAKCDLSGLPVVAGDLADTWIHGVGTYPAEVSTVRGVRQQVMAAQKALALQPGAHLEALQDIGNIYDNLVLFDEHTWGLDVKTWMALDRVYEKTAFLAQKNSPEYQLMEKSWNEQRQRARAAGMLSQKVLQAVQNSDAPSVFNPGGASFSGWVPTGGNTESSLTIFNRPCIYAQEVPALSAIALEAAQPQKAEPAIPHIGPGQNQLQNHRYRLLFNADTGLIEELYDKQQNATLLKAADGMGVFSYRYDVYGDQDIENYLEAYCNINSDWGVKDNGRTNYPKSKRTTFTPKFIQCRAIPNGVVFLYQGTGCDAYGDAKEIELTVTLPPAGDEIFVQLTLRQKQETPFVESASLVMPLAFGQTEYRFNKNGMVINPKTDIVQNASHTLYCLEAFAASYSAETGAGLCSIGHDTPLMAIGETGILAFRSQYEEHKPHLYYNLLNNMWGTNFPQWIGGDFTFRYTLFGAPADQNITQRALALYEGAQVLNIPPVSPPVALPQQVHVSCLKPLGNGVLLRLRDTCGQGRNITLQAPGKTLQPFNLQDLPAGESVPEQITLPLGAYGTASLYIE